MQRTPRSTRRLSEDEEETQLGNVLRRTGARTSCGVMPRTTTPSTATRRSSSCTCGTGTPVSRDASQALINPEVTRHNERSPGHSALRRRRDGDRRISEWSTCSASALRRCPQPRPSPLSPVSKKKTFLPRRPRPKKKNTKAKGPFPREAEEDWQGEAARERIRRHAGTDTCGVPGDTFGLSTPCVVLKVPLIAARVGFARPGSEFRSTSFRRSPPRSHDHALSKPIRDAE